MCDSPPPHYILRFGTVIKKVERNPEEGPFALVIPVSAAFKALSLKM